jgi:hypothetical protein
LLLTSTAERMEAEIQQTPADAQAIGELLGGLGIADEAQLLACYGTSRAEWTPFGSATPVHDVLEELRGDLNQKLNAAGQPALRWEYLDETAFWDSGEDAAIEAQARRLDAEPVLIVIDPLAFYDGLVRSRFSNWIQPRLMGREATFVLALAPFSLPGSALALRGVIQRLARQVFVHHYEPPVFGGMRYARCGANIGDAADFKAWVTSMVVPAVVTAERQRAAVLSAGR